MSEQAVSGDGSDLAMRMAGFTATALTLCELLRRETALIGEGRYDELRGFNEEKRQLTALLTRDAEGLQAADWQVALALPEGAALAESIGRLDEAVRADMGAVQRALVAADRIARIFGLARSTGRASGYGPGGEAGATRGEAIAIDDRI